jgi:hypothetical protein
VPAEGIADSVTRNAGGLASVEALEIHIKAHDAEWSNV